MWPHVESLSHSNPNSDICQRREEYELKKRTCNCITMQYFNLLLLGDGITSNNFTQASAFWHLSQASCVGPREQQSRCLQKTSQRFTDSRMCWWGHSYFAWWTRLQSRVLGETDTAYIRISLLAYCIYTLCQIKFRPWAMLSLFLNCTFFPYRSMSHAFRKSEHIIVFHDIPTCTLPKLLNLI